jgi:hypothetical protein
LRKRDRRPPGDWQVLPSIRSEIAVFVFELLDIAGVVSVFMGTQVVFVGESSSARWTWIGTSVGWEMYGKVDVEEGLADSDVGTQVTLVSSVTRGHGLRAEAACGRISKLVDVVEMTPEGEASGKSFDTQGALVDVREVCLDVEGSLEGVKRPVGAIGTGVTAAESQGLGLMHMLDEGDG